MLKSYKVFIKVAQLGSFSKTAKQLHVAPSSVTRTIDNLEQQLNVSLFKRSTRQLILTQDGEKFYQGVLHLVENNDQLISSLSSNITEPQGCLKISVFESFGRIKICPLIAEFLSLYPKINIEIELDNRMVDLNREDIDCAIRTGLPEDSSLKSRKLISNKTVICASKEYFKQHNKITQPEDFAEHNCLLLNRNKQSTYWYFKNDKQKKKIQVAGNLKSKGGTPLIEAALSGLGVVQMSKWFLEHYIKQGQLASCLDQWDCTLNESNSGDVYVVYPQQNFMNPNIRLFIDFLVERM